MPSTIFFAKTIKSLHCFLVGTSAEYMTATKHLSSNPKLMCHRILSSQRPRRLLDLNIFSTAYILGTNWRSQNGYIFCTYNYITKVKTANSGKVKIQTKQNSATKYHVLLKYVQIISCELTNFIDYLTRHSILAFYIHSYLRSLDWLR